MNEKTESMIGDNGALFVPAKEVTWFQFLQLSRVTNSKLAGWNSKSHWIERGLERLTKPSILQTWTKNSLATKVRVRPKPRTTNFRFDRPWSDLRKAAAEGSENSLNARLFELRPPWTVAWKMVGYEIPLAAESYGQLKIDLFGLGEDAGGAFVSIIELKKGGNKSDSPLLALTEAICYAIQVIRCKEFLLKDEVLLKNGITPAHLQNIRLILAAPGEYWKYWDGDGEERETQLKGIVDAVSDVVRSVVGQEHQISLQPFNECSKELTRICKKYGDDPGSPD